MQKILAWNPEGKTPLGRRVCRREDSITIGSYRKRLQECGLDSAGSRQVPVLGACKQSNEPSDSIKKGLFLEQMSDFQLLRWALLNGVL